MCWALAAVCHPQHRGFDGTRPVHTVGVPAVSPPQHPCVPLPGHGWPQLSTGSQAVSGMWPETLLRWRSELEVSSVLLSKAGGSVGHRWPSRAGSEGPGPWSRRGRVRLGLPAARALWTVTRPASWCLVCSECQVQTSGQDSFQMLWGICFLNVLFEVYAGLVCRADIAVNSCLMPARFKKMTLRPLPGEAPAPAPLPHGSRSSQVPRRKQRQRVASGLRASGSHGPGRAGSLPGAQTGRGRVPLAVSAPSGRDGAEPFREKSVASVSLLPR